MNWLAEYFSRRTPVVNMSMWVYPPLLLGPEGPVAQQPHCLPYPGVELVFSPGESVRRGTRSDELPARYEMRGPATREVREMAQGRAFFQSIEIFAPSRYNRDFLIRVNDAFAFVPVFSADGAPGFFGTCVEQPGASPAPQQMPQPWCFRGYISI
ncbi:hypothetical protein PWP93_20790 [Paraburkholderia sp. A1RI-2L]|uniref:hypothetical protein n=1 Tax=Paraburkholderia sp. A1RI-2L TaxID=3028367 RepID=UPI003B7FF176